MPKFTHDGCPACEFLGTYFDHDVYICRNKEKPELSTIMARWGNDGPEYHSDNVGAFSRSLRDPDAKIKYVASGKEKPYRDHCMETDYRKAMILAFAIHGLLVIPFQP